MEDHHVDRPDVEARQRVELTGTNRSIGLIIPCLLRQTRVEPHVQRSASRKGGRQQRSTPILQRHIPRDGLKATQRATACRTDILRKSKQVVQIVSRSHQRIARGFRSVGTGFGWPGGFGERPPPDPIPNSAVKLLSVNGTVS